MSPSNLYQQVVSVTAEYLGPAADRFVSRQVKNHLHKDPLDLQRKDLNMLIDWIHLSMSLLSSDTELVNSYIENLQSLALTKKVVGGHAKTNHV